MIEHIPVPTELIEKIQGMIKGYNEGYIKVYLEDGKLDCYWTFDLNTVETSERETNQEAREKIITTFDMREKPFTQDDLVFKILDVVQLLETQESPYEK